ncbi:MULTISPECIES: hypothetical protein [unclassified Paenibacillus]|uniref:hypothetical protein n=1 Tax=unclassified Paenibacillus TaxID=185978 RepID=UPI001C108F72|nr:MULTISPECIES: hypothetical protein [unclassified Paenibacillus]MBU5440441.1 hypothetical protein [Paenibacillus sp. MSJ-34]CAH0119637.1 hypothetical protein PAE9249_02142 [Paenibacillus sp. CECT 9249]
MSEAQLKAAFVREADAEAAANKLKALRIEQVSFNRTGGRADDAGLSDEEGYYAAAALGGMGYMPGSTASALGGMIPFAAVSELGDALGDDGNGGAPQRHIVLSASVSDEMRDKAERIIELEGGTLL